MSFLKKVMDLTTAKIGETITLRDQHEVYFQRFDGSNECREVNLSRGTVLKVTGFREVKNPDDHGAIVDGVYYSDSDERPEMFYEVTVYSFVDGSPVGTLGINPIDVKECKDVVWIGKEDGYVKEIAKKLRHALKNGQTELFKDLTRVLRELSIRQRIQARRKRENERRRAIAAAKEDAEILKETSNVNA